MKKMVLYSVLLLLVSNVNAAFITPSSALSSSANNVGVPNDLIKDAVDITYIAPSPASGGGGTSNHTSSLFNTWTFNFDTSYEVDTLYLWDYYSHSPKNWILNFFDGTNATGSNLGAVNFSILPGAIHTSTLHEVNFSNFSNVMSISLGNTTTSVSDNPSPNSGVGLSEVHFGGNNISSVPAPAAVWLLGSGFIGLVGMRKKSAQLSKKHA
jgi:hypothetical protein